MARKYEYVIHGPPLSPQSENATPRKTLSQKGHQYRNSNLRTLFRDSSSPTAQSDHFDSLRERSLSSPTTPKAPPTPPTAEEEDQTSPEEKIQGPGNEDHSRLRSFPVTPVNGNSPPTPDDTPPRDHLRMPIRPFLALRPSVASTRAESFRTARENIYSDDEYDDFSPDLISAFPQPATATAPELPVLNGDNAYRNEQYPKDEEACISHRECFNESLLTSTEMLDGDSKHHSHTTAIREESTPETQFHFDPVNEDEKIDLNQISSAINSAGDHHGTTTSPIDPTSVHQQSTLRNENTPLREKSLRDRIKEKTQLPATPSTEAFANVIGWNDGRVQRSSTGSAPNRWSSPSNPSAVEAYVVESPIKPQKRGTLRKVIKNESLRSASSPIPESNRTSMQSVSESPHRLLHKKQKLNNQHRWSTGSEFSKRSLSWGSAQLPQRQETIKVAVIPQRRSSLRTSASSSRRHSRSISNATGPADRTMPPVSTPVLGRKRAFSDSHDQSPTSERLTVVPVRSSSLSDPASRNASRRDSLASQQFSYLQAEKDLRTTLDRMETERLSSSLRRGSDESDPPTPTPKPNSHSDDMTGTAPTELLQVKQPSSLAASNSLKRRPVTIEINGATPGTKEWAELRPSTLTGTPFSQISAMSASPDIIEARAINFFPHNNNSLQLIEHNRLSETPAVKALRAQGVHRANTVPSPNVTIGTPRTSAHLISNETTDVNSPLRNPRKPPDPPQLQFAVTPATPHMELNHQLGITPDVSPAKLHKTVTSRRRPSLQDRDHSQSFIKSLSQGLSLRNAKNPKANQELDSTLHPFWRPRAFWDDEDYRKRQQQNQQLIATTQGDDVAEGTDRGLSGVVTVIERPNTRLGRSNSIYSGPMSIVRRFSERRRQKRLVDDHIAQQQALVKQTSYSSLQRFHAGRKIFGSGMQPLRAVTLDFPIRQLGSLRQRVTDSRARREDEKREKKRDALRKSIGPDVVMQSDSRFPAGNAGTDYQTNAATGPAIEHLGGRKLDESEVLGEMLRNARAEEVATKRGLRV